MKKVNKRKFGEDTRFALVDALTAKVRELHSYDCPCNVALPVDGGNPAFLEWVAAETRAE